MTLARTRRRTASLMVGCMLALTVATLQQTGTVSVPGVSQPAAAHADDWGWVPCVGGYAAQWGQLGYVAYEWYMGADWELGGATIYFSVWALTSALTGYECINYVLDHDDDTCYIYQTTQQGNFIVADTAPTNGPYTEFTCAWR
jgi:hypothetical protein